MHAGILRRPASNPAGSQVVEADVSAVAGLDAGLDRAVAAARVLADRRAGVGVDRVAVVTLFTRVDVAVAALREVLRAAAARREGEREQQPHQGRDGEGVRRAGAWAGLACGGRGGPAPRTRSRGGGQRAGDLVAGDDFEVGVAALADRAGDAADRRRLRRPGSQTPKVIVAAGRRCSRPGEGSSSSRFMP